MFIILIIIVVIVIIVKGNGYWAARTRNSVISWATGTEGHCCECKYCSKDTSGERSATGYFCRLSKCQNITESTIMNCFEKPQITEEDLNELFGLGIWNNEGQQYLKQNLLGKSMTWNELNNYLEQLPQTHPEFINR